VTANRDRDVAIMECIERRELALAWHAEHVANAVDDELIDQNFGRGSCAIIGAHRESPSSIARQSRSGHKI
jgi:hypothetical protein